MKELKVELSINEDLFYKILDNLYLEKITIENYILKLIEKDLSSVVFLGNGLNYYVDKEKIYSKDNKEIFLTKIEEKVFKLLINNLDRVVSVEEFYANIWKNRNISIYSLRNKIMSIRSKLYPELIINVSNRGYKINIPHS